MLENLIESLAAVSLVGTCLKKKTQQKPCIRIDEEDCTQKYECDYIPQELNLKPDRGVVNLSRMFTLDEFKLLSSHYFHSTYIQWGQSVKLDLGAVNLSRSITIIK